MSALKELLPAFKWALWVPVVMLLAHGLVHGTQSLADSRWVAANEGHIHDPYQPNYTGGFYAER